jgi:hypothetical protein
MTDYTVPGGKLNRGMAVYDVLASIKGAEVGTLRCSALYNHYCIIAAAVKDVHVTAANRTRVASQGNLQAAAQASCHDRSARTATSLIKITPSCHVAPAEADQG